MYLEEKGAEYLWTSGVRKCDLHYCCFVEKDAYFVNGSATFSGSDHI